MRAINSTTTMRRLVTRAAGLCAVLLAGAAQAAAPGITGVSGTPEFNLVAAPGNISQPDGATIYSWGYGCSSQPSAFVPPTISNANCPQMQLPGPTLVVTEGDMVTVILTNKLPKAAGNTSILFPGFNVTTSGGTPGLLTQEAANGGTVTYTFKADSPGTHSYYSGTQGDLQVEMGLFGALIVLPTNVPAACKGTQTSKAQSADRGNGVPADFRLSQAAFNHASTCYDREYLFQFSEIDPNIHRQAAEQAGVACSSATGCMVVETEPYHAGVLHDQRALDARRHGPELRGPVSAPALQRQPAHAPGRAGAGAHHRPGPHGSTRSTSTATTCACWRATATCS